MKNLLKWLDRELWLAELSPSPHPLMLGLLFSLGRSRPRQWLNLWLRCRNRQSSLAATRAAARNARMALLRAVKRRKRLTAKRTAFVWLINGLRRRRRHCLRRWRVRRMRLQTHLFRWLLVNLLSLLLWLALRAFSVWLPRPRS